ncbi:MAG TPA: hypothetical protein PK295_04905 [Candidatus Magasanikbacteria bacterium]|nr:hypothetical protein [Candidatus Magasanikbacteria bacterium]
MIHIEQGQKVAESEIWIVATTTGDYADSALIEFYDSNNPGVILGAFEAQYIKYGGMVYRCNNAKELGESILKIDPDSTHTAASYVRMSNELLAQMEGGSLEPSSLDEVQATEQAKMEDAIENPVDSLSITSTGSEIDSNTNNATLVEEAPVMDTSQVNNNVSTTTSTVQIDDVAATTPQATTTSIPSGLDTAKSAIDTVSDAADAISTTTEAISNAIETLIDTTSSTLTQ